MTHQGRSQTDAPSRAGHRGLAKFRPLVFLAEDDDDIREALAALLTHDGFAVWAAPDGSTLFDWLFRRCGPGFRIPDLIITDHRMPGYCALDILDGLAEMRWEVPVIVITAFGSEVRSLARLYGVRAVFDKPFEPNDLRKVAMRSVNWDTRRLRPYHDMRTEYEMTGRAREVLRHAVPKHDSSSS